MGKLFNFVRVSTPTTGTATTLTIGSALAPFQTPAAAGAVAGDVLTYTIEDGTQREVTFGTVGAGGTTITRAATPIYSSTGALLDLSGAAILSFGPSAADLMNPDLFGTPGAPPAGIVRLGESTLAGCDWPSWRSAQTYEQFFNPHMSRRRWGAVQFAHNWSSPNLFGLSGSGVFRVTGVTNAGGGFGSASTYAERQPYAQIGTAATAGALAFYSPQFPGSLPVILGGSDKGGFFCAFAFSPATTVADARYFVGLQSSMAAPTNVDPATLTNVIGLARVDGSSNLNIVFAGSATQTPIDLGTNFPALGAAVDYYRLELFSSPSDNSKVSYQVTRWTGTSSIPAFSVTGVIDNTTPGTTLPATTAGLGPAWWVTNNATATAARIYASHFYFWGE